jgi:hypothetical protein
MRVALLVVILAALCANLLNATPRAQADTIIPTGFPPRGGVGLAIFDGGTAIDLVAAANANNCALISAWVVPDGQFIGLIIGAPDFVNKPFYDRIGGTVLPRIALVVLCRAIVPDWPYPTAPAPVRTNIPSPPSTPAPFPTKAPTVVATPFSG